MLPSEINFGLSPIDKSTLFTKEFTPSNFPGFNKIKNPPEVDWRSTSKVNSPKNQGQKCGACWAFTANTALESALAIRSGLNSSSFDLSVQYLLDCAVQNGCLGTWPDYAWDYIKTHSYF